jgi:UDP-N-acetylmuramoyl-L-alanyl-D-glutamate--2,6-diaminopimelate ligase
MKLTTPDAVSLQRYLSRMVEKGISTAAVEVSSHALQLKRTWGTEFLVAAFTNLTQDHLDFHHTMENYLEAKLKLFRPPPEGGRSSGPTWAVINIDDPYAERFVETTKAETISYGRSPDADVRAGSIEPKNSGSIFTLDLPGESMQVSLKLPGVFNVYNALAAASIAVCLGLPSRTVKAGLESVDTVPGRMEFVRAGQPFNVVIDYAHSPDALDHVLRALREITAGRVICVFGCGGDRDIEKRPLMGAVASRMSDLCVLTSDNPRGERPESILEDIKKGIPPGVNNYRVIAHRREAIAEAIVAARAGDTVLIAGKGHEDYQIVGNRVLPFDDREVAKEAIARVQLDRGVET